MDGILSAHQPAYLPWLGYFHKIAISNIFVILDNVQLEKNSFINRNKVKTSQGALWLTVPVLISGHTQKAIKDMEINNTIDWRTKHWKTIYLNYKKAAHFAEFSDYFQELYKKEWIKLTDLLEYTLQFFLNALNIKTKIYRQSELQIYSKKQELILDLCKYFKAKIFLFGVLGKKYADTSLFGDNGIRITFQEYNHPVYPQLQGDFIPNLSIIDLLFNVGAHGALEIIMGKNITNKEIKEMLK
jgi:hypothetical protein